MVGENLQAHEQGCDYNAPGISAPIAQSHTANGGWDEGQSEYLPYMTGSNDNEEIAGECPDHGSQCCHPYLEIKAAEHDIEAQEHNEHICGNIRQAQGVPCLDSSQCIGAVVRRCQLICRHA